MSEIENIKLNEFVDSLGNIIDVFFQDSVTRYAPTGEEFVEFIQKGNSVQEIINNYKVRLLDYINDKKKESDVMTLYWRKRPGLKKWDESCMIYSRLLISDKILEFSGKDIIGEI